jgi:hypothetical protein
VIMRHLEAMILQERGDNRNLLAEIKEKLSPESQERLFRLFQDHEHEIGRLKRKASMTSAAIASHLAGFGR